MPGKKTDRSKKKAPKSAASNVTWSDRLHYFEAKQEEIARTIRELVEIESPSDSKPATDRIGTILAGKFAALGGDTKLHRVQDFGDHLQVNFAGRANTKPVLLLGHFDTVYPLGTLETMLCGVAGDRLHGPGVLDMKSGIALMLHAIEALQAWHDGLPRPVTVFLVSDEEVGRASSRKIKEALAKESAAGLGPDPAVGLRGALKTARKGLAEYKLR